MCRDLSIRFMSPERYQMTDHPWSAVTLGDIERQMGRIFVAVVEGHPSSNE
jgi:hypothetical protein